MVLLYDRWDRVLRGSHDICVSSPGVLRSPTCDDQFELLTSHNTDPTSSCRLYHTHASRNKGPRRGSLLRSTTPTSASGPSDNHPNLQTQGSFLDITATTTGLFSFNFFRPNEYTLQPINSFKLHLSVTTSVARVHTPVHEQCEIDPKWVTIPLSLIHI